MFPNLRSDIAKSFCKQEFDDGIISLIDIFEYDVYIVRTDEHKICTCVDFVTKQSNKRCEKCLGIGYKISIDKIKGHAQNYNTPSMQSATREKNTGKIYYTKPEYSVKHGDIFVELSKMEISRVYKTQHEYISSNNDHIYTKSFTAPMKIYEDAFIQQFKKKVGL